MGSNKEKLHAGHRARLRKRFFEEGLDAFEDHQVIELLLFYAIPRRDTNEIAHLLLRRYGSNRELGIRTVELAKRLKIAQSTATHLSPARERWLLRSGFVYRPM